MLLHLAIYDMLEARGGLQSDVTEIINYIGLLLTLTAECAVALPSYLVTYEMGVVSSDCTIPI